MNTTDAPWAVFCMPLQLEYDEVRNLLRGGDFGTRKERDTHYATTALQGRHTGWNVALTVSDHQNEAAAVAVERAVAAFSPQVLFMVGIAGGRRDSAIGDVIAATEVYGYESGKETDEEVLTRIKTLPSSYRLTQEAREVDREGAWLDRLALPARSAPPRVHHRPLAAGNRVIAGNASLTAALLHRECGDAQGIEMEGYGALAAAWRNSDVDVMVVRGVSDLVGGKDDASDAANQPVAARNAGAFALALLEQLEPRTGRGTAWEPPRQPRHSAADPVADRRRSSIRVEGRDFNGANIVGGDQYGR
ncbi:phosphorylase [Glycomyces harbinensis]|uniref:Nucleoside phosphorylase n=1 Tax=Glycomyces harbinensis TaxID=58114 RepID=A0A1G6W0D6_9ACTN|nr:phosphorylase [Glycomyces harbinensis]SDD59281.1 Nucleoside phosphorylase [Glycomyces harbinensis]